MNFRTLSNFLRVAEIGSIKGAAEVVNIAQPALTRQIALLEEEFGAQLFIRHPRGVALTEAGEQLRACAERVLHEIARTRGVLSATVQKPSGSLALGLPTSMLYVLSSTVISTYQKAYPDVRLKVHEAVGHVIEDLLCTRRLDVAIMIARPPSTDIDVRPLVTEDVYLAGPPDAGLDLERPVPITYLAEVPIILLAPQNQVRLKIERALADCDLKFQTSLEVEGQPLVLDLIRHGIGYTVIPFGAVEAEMAAGRISGAPIRGLTVTWALGVNRMRAHTPAVREMVRLIQDVANSRIAGGEWRGVH